MLDATYLLSGHAAQLIELDYPNALKIFRKDNALVYDNKGRACVPASYLNRFPGYRAHARAASKEILALGPLFAPSAPKSPLVVGISALKAAMPMNWMRGVHQPDLQVFRADVDVERVDGGRIPDTKTLLRILAAGRMRTVSHGKSTTRFYLSDFLYPMSWASPAEKSWRAGSEMLRELLRKRKGEKDVAAVEATGLPTLADEDVELTMPSKRGRPVTGAPRGEALLPPGAELLESPATRHPSKSLAFTWETGELALPPPAQLDYYLAAIPEELIENAWHAARNWAEVLFEDRTGYNVAVGQYSEAEWPALRAAREKAVYENRMAWKGGALQPLFPAGFSFIF